MNNALRKPMPTPLSHTTNHGAYEAGRAAKTKGYHRVTPYYNEKEKRDGKWVDVTEERDRNWFAGFDGLPETNLPPEESNLPEKVTA